MAYKQFLDWEGLQCFFILIQGGTKGDATDAVKRTLSSTNNAFCFLGTYFDLSLAGQIDEVQDLSVDLAQTGGGGVTFAMAAATITGDDPGQLGYTNAPIT